MVPAGEMLGAKLAQGRRLGGAAAGARASLEPLRRQGLQDRPRIRARVSLHVLLAVGIARST